MKKLLMFLVVATFATFGVSCSSDDNSTDDKKEEKQLVLKVDRTEINTGEKVNFRVEVDNKKVDGFKISVNGKEEDSDYVFSEAGTFTVIAKKKGYADSKALSIKVTPNKESGKLELSVSKNEIEVGDQVTFTVKVNGKNITDFVVKLSEGEILTGNNWTAEEEGEFEFVASKTGFGDSNKVTVRVIGIEKPEYENYIILGKDTFELGYGLYGVSMYEDGKDAEGKPVYTKAVYTLNGGKTAFRYVFQFFKGSNTDEDYDNAWEEGGVLQGMIIYIENKDANSSPLNTEFSEWIWGNMYTILDGDIEYNMPDDSSEMLGGYEVNEKGELNVALASTGNYNSPSLTKFVFEYSGIAEGAYRFTVKKPNENSTTNVKAKIGKESLRVSK